MGIGAVAGGLGGGIGAGVGGLSGAFWGGIASGAASGGGMAALNGGGFGDIMYGAMGGALMGGSMAFVGGAAMMGLGNIASNIQAPWVKSAVADGMIKMHPNYLDVYKDFVGSIGGASGGSGSQLFDYFIAKNGTHLRVDQYQNYKNHIKAGTAPNWMQRNYDSWTRNIHIPVIPQSSWNVDLSKFPARNIYLGDYKRVAGRYEILGQPAYDVTGTIQFGDQAPINWSWEDLFSTRSPQLKSGIGNNIRYVRTSARGVIPRPLIPGDNVMGIWLKMIVTHSSHL